MRSEQRRAKQSLVNWNLQRAAAATREAAWCRRLVFDPTDGEVLTSHLSFWTKWRISPFALFPEWKTRFFVKKAIAFCVPQNDNSDSGIRELNYNLAVTHLLSFCHYWTKSAPYFPGEESRSSALYSGNEGQDSSSLCSSGWQWGRWFDKLEFINLVGQQLRYSFRYHM